MEKRVFYDRNVPTIAFSKAGLLDLCRHKVSQLLAQPQPEAQPTAKPQRPSLAEQQQIREADAAHGGHPAKFWPGKTRPTWHSNSRQRPGRARQDVRIEHGRVTVNNGG